jgi:hypothetical protein
MNRIATVNYDGGGWTIPYLIGVSAYLSDHVDDLSDADTLVKYAGVSAGSCVALASALGVSMDDLMEDVVSWGDVCRRCPLLTLRAVRAMCEKMILDDEQVRSLTSSRSFALGVTRVFPLEKDSRRFVGNGKLKTVVVSSFENKKDLVEKVVSSCRLPMINTLPSLNGVPHEYVDGNLLTRFVELPWRDENDIEVRVSPNRNAEGSDVSYQEKVPLQLHVVPMDEQGLRRMYDAGRKDGIEVLGRILGNKKILHSGQEDYDTNNNDWCTSFDQLLHVDRRRNLRLPERQEGSARRYREGTQASNVFNTFNTFPRAIVHRHHHGRSRAVLNLLSAPPCGGGSKSFTKINNGFRI